MLWLKYREWLVLPLLGLALSVCPIGCDYISISEKFGAEAVASCNEKCPFQNRTSDGHFDLNCGSNCSIHQCTQGCDLWKNGLANSCQTSCNVTSEAMVSRELYCVIGCNEALNFYYQKLKELIATPPAPALVADTLAPTALSLAWDPPSLTDLAYLLQWRFEEPPATHTWQYYNGTFDNDNIIHLTHLQPYTKYRFRVAIFVSGESGSGEPIYSESSVVVSTLESGPPASRPSSVRAAAPDGTRVAVSWEAGHFANGPLIGYVLRLTDTEPNVYSALKDMPSSNSSLFYMFQNLRPEREYEISVSMRNAVGEGPRAYVKVTTPPMPISNNQQPTLILGSEHSVLAAPANDMFADPTELYTSAANIAGVDIDISSDYLFVSDSDGFVYRSSLSKKGKPTAIITPDSISYKPYDLSVDWLNKYLYILGGVKHNMSDLESEISHWEIWRSDFEGRDQLIAFAGLLPRPIHFEVDPYNGYMYWTLGGGERGGLYRLDLPLPSHADVQQDSDTSSLLLENARDVADVSTPRLLLRDARLGPFAVDYPAFRVLVAHHAANNILAVSLDGGEVSQFRSNTARPVFAGARWLAYGAGLFYCSSARGLLLAEEHHAASDTYFHNQYPLLLRRAATPVTQVLVGGGRGGGGGQRVPAPALPPARLQARAGARAAHVRWTKPPRLPPQGPAAAPAVQHYRLRLTHLPSRTTTHRDYINTTSYVLDNLEEDTEYAISVAAATESGTGPWSPEFVCRTLDGSPSTQRATLLWSTEEGLIQTDLTGDNEKILLDSLSINSSHISSVSWYRDKLYAVTNASLVVWVNVTSGDRGFVPGATDVAAVAVDWVGKRLYCSNPKQQLIMRSRLDGSGRAPLALVAAARALLLDSVRARLYWSSGRAVEGAALADRAGRRLLYYPARIFSGNQVMGITMDEEGRWLYWLVRSYEGSELHRAPTADRIPPEIQQWSEATLVWRLGGGNTAPGASGGLAWWRGRTVWGADADTGMGVGAGVGVLSDERVHRASSPPSPARLRAGAPLAARDPLEHDIANAESLIAIPEMVDPSSIRVSGNWTDFAITWAPDQRVNVNASDLMYDVTLQSGDINMEWVVVADAGAVVVRRWAGGAHAPLQLAVRARSAWGAAPPARKERHAPPAPPPPPPRPRLYLHRDSDSDGRVTATFRWDAPAQDGGAVLGYESQCWVQGAGAGVKVGARAGGDPRPSACADAALPAGTTQLVLRDKPTAPTNVYYFKVRAFTEAGYGPYSATVNVSSDEVNPVPRVMLSSKEVLRVIDLDSGDSETVPKSSGIPVDFDVSFRDNVVYWVNQLEEIFSSRINGSGHFKVLSINGSASSLCVDWSSRRLYWAQAEPALHAAYSATLPQGAARSGTMPLRPKITRLFHTTNAVYSLQVVPLTRSLYWYEETSQYGFGTLMTSKTDGTDMKPFFNQMSVSDYDQCNCPDDPQIAKPFVIDMTTSKYELYWVDPWTHQIIAADMEACKCRVVVDATEKKKYGFTPMSITVDSKYVYWYNATERNIYYTTKRKQSKIEQVKSIFGYKILAFDTLSQPYPPMYCLYPESKNLTPKVIETTANSIRLNLPSIENPEKCMAFEYDMPLTEYTIMYSNNSDLTMCDKESCSYVMSTEQEVLLNDLDSFTNYTVVVEATNYYAKLNEVRPLVGKATVFQTDAEAPPAAMGVEARALGPFSARVQWQDPDLPAAGSPGARALRHELHWQTDDPAHTLHTEHNTVVVGEGESSCDMSGLSAGTWYRVWVRARWAGGTDSPPTHRAGGTDSPPTRLRTHPLPPALRLLRAAPAALLLQWRAPSPAEYTLHSYAVEYRARDSEVWSRCEPGNGTDDEWHADNLEPATAYTFRLKLQYTPPDQAPATYWPTDNTYTFETLPDVPGAPGAALWELVGARAARARWQRAPPRGRAVTAYRVWAAPPPPTNGSNVTANESSIATNVTPPYIPDDADDELRARIIRDGLILLHNTTENYWVVGWEQVPVPVLVWVQARNAVGWGPLGPAGSLGGAAGAGAGGEGAPPAPGPAPALPAALAALLLLTVAVAAHSLYVFKNRSKKKSLDNAATAAPYCGGTDVELATLRQLPIRHSNNIIYNQGTPPELSAVPHVRRDQITLKRFLGAGAFGEVFEGVARGLPGAKGDVAVAVKTLRAGASAAESASFAAEAALMAQFRHAHILRLLAVCAPPTGAPAPSAGTPGPPAGPPAAHFLLLELMDGGDLLSYLRTKRTLLYTPESLTLLDLLNMCVDVTTGCRYLEQMHFVHRDLAARNCLVAHPPQGRVVKIGDFGLARDIYKNDYYRKEGEGLLPVRWMAVESLVDGVFSCQSDVWAWAVTCCEILSLGQQPYPARTNRQVLALVRAGGRPARPPNCPSALYELLKRCWSYRAEQRPTFKECLRVVTDLRDKTSRHITLTGSAARNHYLALLPPDAAVENRSYLLDENQNPYIDEELSEQGTERSRTTPDASLKYLEMMYGDGYEIPRGSRRSFVATTRRPAPSVYRTQSLKMSCRPSSATITPLRNGLVKRASLCDDLGLELDYKKEASTSNSTKDHDNKTQF